MTPVNLPEFDGTQMDMIFMMEQVHVIQPFNRLAI